MFKKKQILIAGVSLLSAMMIVPSVKTLHLTKKVSAAKTYTITPKSSTYKGNYKKATAYNSSTKQYFLIRSYLELLKKRRRQI